MPSDPVKPVAPPDESWRVTSLEGRGVRVDVFAHDESENAVLATTYADGQVETAFAYERSIIPFHESAGLAIVGTPPSEHVVALARKRFPRAWEITAQLREMNAAYRAQRSSRP